jgi:allophanate hydrolase subunit 2
MQDISLSVAVVAAQPRESGPGRNGIKAGAIGVYPWGDPIIDDHEYTGGAVWIGAHGDPAAQMDLLRLARRELVRYAGFTEAEVDAELLRVPEYRDERKRHYTGRTKARYSTPDYQVPDSTLLVSLLTQAEPAH